jgi:hypothetical protein
MVGKCGSHIGQVGLFYGQLKKDLLIGVGKYHQSCELITTRIRIHCRAARCRTARDPFDHFEIRVNTLRFELARISKWSNRLRVAPYGAARQQIWFHPAYGMTHLQRVFFTYNLFLYYMHFIFICYYQLSKVFVLPLCLSFHECRAHIQRNRLFVSKNLYYSI